MALIDYCCTDDACATIVENHFRRAAQSGEPLPPCEACGKPTHIIWLPPRTTWRIDPIVIYRDADGSFRFPGDANGLSAANYDKQGLQRVELRSAAEVRQFEKQWNAQERSRGAARVESEHRGRQLREGETRKELFSRMKTMSNMGRDVARAAISRGNARPQPRGKEPGCHVEVMSYTRGNRDEARGSDGRRRRD